MNRMLQHLGMPAVHGAGVQVEVLAGLSKGALAALAEAGVAAVQAVPVVLAAVAAEVVAEGTSSKPF